MNKLKINAEIISPICLWNGKEWDWLDFFIDEDNGTFCLVDQNWIERAIEENIKLQESIINESDNKSRVNRANKKKTKLIKQLDEIKLYDLALAHVANERIEIDLDDGVKVNYAKFQNIEVVDPNTNKTRKINLLKKI